LAGIESVVPGEPQSLLAYHRPAKQLSINIPFTHAADLARTVAPSLYTGQRGPSTENVHK